MSWLEQDKTNRNGKKEQLCWTCMKNGGLCSWTHSFTPVEGWTADPDVNLSNISGKTGNQTYRIYDCPLYHSVEMEKKEIDEMLSEVKSMYSKMYKARYKQKRRAKT